jgi:hypothetical protein
MEGSDGDSQVFGIKVKRRSSTVVIIFADYACAALLL